jgi:hypothetical protein
MPQRCSTIWDRRRAHSSPDKRFEVDGANFARNFLNSRGTNAQDLDTVWTSIALHIPEFMHPVIALLTAGVNMDVLGTAYESFAENERKSGGKRLSADAAFQGGHHPDVLRRYLTQAYGADSVVSKSHGSGADYGDLRSLSLLEILSIAAGNTLVRSAYIPVSDRTR